jgi:hypothetical protein
MSTDKDLDKAKASAMDDVKIKESRIPNFTVQKKAGVSKTAKAEAQPTGQKANDIDNIVSMPKLRVLRGRRRGNSRVRRQEKLYSTGVGCFCFQKGG